MIKKRYLYAILSIILFLTGCASVQTQQEWERISAFTRERTGIETRWEQTEEDAKNTKEEINKLLSDGLTEEDAVKIALLNNRKLQATFEEIGVAKSDLVQAGLFTNPNLSAVFRLPFGGGGTDMEGAGVLNIADFWQIPLRKKVALARLETAILLVSEEILNTVSEAKHAHNEYIALSQIRDSTEKIKELMEEWRDHLIYRQKFGFSSELDIEMANASVLDTEAAHARIEKELQLARFRLNQVLGLSPEQSDYEAVGSMTERKWSLPELETMISHALSNRPDIQMARVKVEESRRVLALERARIFRNVEAGVAYARESDGDEFLGPEIGIQLPIFDQNQAQIARAEYRVRQAEKELTAKIGKVREEVLASFERLSLTRQHVDLIGNQLLPSLKSAVEYAEKYFNAMQLNKLFLLEARKKFFETQRRYLEALREQRNLQIELEKTLGGAMRAASH